MAHHQMTLIPVSDSELTRSAYRLAQLYTQVEEAKATWLEATEAHKEEMAVYHKAIAAEVATIRRAEQEHKEGVTEAQIDVLFAQTRETQEE